MALSPQTETETQEEEAPPSANAAENAPDVVDVTLALPRSLHAALPPEPEKTVQSRRSWRVRSWVSPREARVLIAVLAAAFLVLYGSTFTHRYTFDSISYATDIRRAEETGVIGRLFHPHHLLFNGIGLLFHRLLCLWNPHTATLTALQATTAFFAALGLTALAALIYEETGSAWAGLTGAVALGGTFGWWFAGTDGRANLAATAVLLWGVYAGRRAARRGSLPWWGGMGALLGLTCLIHQSHLLFVPVALLAAALTGGGAIRARVGRVALLAAAFAVTFATPYAIVCFAVKDYRSLADVLDWLTTYGRQDTWWSLHWRRNLPRDVQALYKAFTGQELAPSWTPPTGNAASEPWGRITLALWALPVLVAGVGVARGALQRRRAFLLAPVLGLGVYGAFFTIWDPGYFVHWLAQSAFVVLFVAVLWPEGARHWLARVSVTACALALVWVTWAGAVKERTRTEGNPHRDLALRVARIVDRQGIVIASGMGGAAEAEVYIPYFARMQVLALHAAWADAGGDTPRATAAIRALIDAVLRRGNRVYLLSEAISDAGSLRAMNRRYGVSELDLNAVFAPYDRETVDRNGYVVIYRLKPHPHRGARAPSAPPKPALPARPPQPPRPLVARPAAKVVTGARAHLRPAGRRHTPQRRTRRARTRHRRYGIMRSWSRRAKSSSSARPAR